MQTVAANKLAPIVLQICSRSDTQQDAIRKAWNTKIDAEVGGRLMDHAFKTLVPLLPHGDGPPKEGLLGGASQLIGCMDRYPQLRGSMGVHEYYTKVVKAIRGGE